MPLPTALRSLVRNRSFWVRYFWQLGPDLDDYYDLDAFSNFENCTLDVRLPDGFGLALQIGEAVSYLGLSLTFGDREPVRIGWDDQAHWWPDVLRWCELERICRAASLTDPGFRHPGPLLLLLSRFTPICRGDDPDRIVPLLEAAWDQAGEFTPREITAALEIADSRDAGWQWDLNGAANGWSLDQLADREWDRTAYSLRHAENPEFPTADYARLISAADAVLNAARTGGTETTHEFVRTGNLALVPAMLRELNDAGHTNLARALDDAPSIVQVCWVVEVLHGLEPGTLIKNRARSHRELRTKHGLDLTVPMQDAERPLPAAAGKFILDTLLRPFRDLNIGRAELVMSGCSENGLSVLVKGEKAHGVRLAREMLWWCRAPSTRLSHGWNGLNLLELAEKPTGPSECVLQLARLEAIQLEFDEWRDYRLDRVPLGVEQRATLRTVLAVATGEGPDADGWFTVRLPDEGLLRICFPRLDQNPDLDGGTVVIEQLSLGASQILYDLIAATGLWLLPAMLTTSADEANGDLLPWPPLHFVPSPAVLNAVLKAGSYAWWQHREDAAGLNRI